MESAADNALLRYIVIIRTQQSEGAEAMPWGNLPLLRLRMELLGKILKKGNERISFGKLLRE